MSLHKDTRVVVDPSTGCVTPLTPLDAGGSNSVTADAARVALNLVPLASVGVDDGIATLDADKYIPQERFAHPADQAVTVQGTVTSALTNVDLTFKITNHDSRLTYTIVPTLGSCIRNGDTITYSTGSVGGAGGFTINGKTYAVTIIAPYVNKPVIQSPTNGATNMPKSVTITAGAFSPFGTSDTHASSSWQVASDSAFTNIVTQSLVDTTNKTTWTVSNLVAAMTYYVRVKYTGTTLGDSVWSDPIAFSTLISFVATTEKAILANTGVSGFGTSVSVSDNGLYAVVGTGEGLGAGYVYFYNGTNWVLQSNLPVSSSESTTMYGYATAINNDGSYVVLGGQHDGIKIYTRTGTTWALLQTLKPSDYNTNDQFGLAVSMSADARYIAVGSPSQNTYKGGYYVFYRATTTFAQQAKITSPFSVVHYMGGSIAINSDGTYMVVGNNFGDGGLSQACVYLRTGTTWAFQSYLTAPAGYSGGTSYGNSVAISGDGFRAAVGANTYTPATVGGAVVIFVRTGTTWAVEAKINNPSPAGYTYFGYSVAVSSDGGYLFAGSYGARKAFAFKRTGSTWALDKTYIASDTATGSEYGRSIDCSQDSSTVIVGALTARKAYIIA